MKKTTAPDPVWKTLRKEVLAMAAAEPMLASFLHATVLNHPTLEDALSFLLSGKLEVTVLTDTDRIKNKNNYTENVIGQTIPRATAAK